VTTFGPRRWGLALLLWCQPAHALPPGPAHPGLSLVTLSLESAKGVVSAPLAPTCLHQRLKSVGRIAYDDLRVAHVMSPVSGRVDRVHAKLGDALLAHGVLATLRSSDYAAARADWHKTQVAVDAAKRDLARQDGLYRRDAVPQQVVLAAWDLYRRALSERDRAWDTLTLYGGADPSRDTPVDVYALRTPIAGVVIGRSIYPGMEVAGQYGGGNAQELFLVADLSQVWVVAEVPEADASRIRQGADVVVAVEALPGTPLAAKLDQVADTLDPEMHTLRVRCLVPNATGKLKPDMYASLDIAATGHHGLAVPAASLVRLGDAAFVYVEHAGPSGPGRVFERRHVRVDAGEDLGPMVPILHGLAPGDRVVTEGRDVLVAAWEAQP
jgi:cobalt-zinc-cadmium efflux system membrane fusion protein